MTTMTLSAEEFDDLNSQIEKLTYENFQLRGKAELAYKKQWEDSVEREVLKKENSKLKADYESLKVKFSTVYQELVKREKELKELRGQMELID